MRRIQLVTYEVEIGYITVDGRYYSFPFKLWVNGKLKSEGEYSSDHDWDDRVAFIRMQLDGEAAKSVIEQEL
jgi:hypothetical protein